MKKEKIVIHRDRQFPYIETKLATVYLVVLVKNEKGEEIAVSPEEYKAKHERPKSYEN